MGNKNSGTPKAALLKLDGTQTDLLGNVSETEFFKFLKLPSEHYSNLEKELTPQQALSFRNHVVRMKYGTCAAMPMKCAGGTLCPVKDCPFTESKSWPLTESCPIESNLLASWMKSYVDELGVDVQSRTEMVLVNQLVECDIIDYRASIGFSTDPDAWKLLKVDITSAGDDLVSETTNPHPLLEIKERTQARRLKVLEALSATRREKLKSLSRLGDAENEENRSHWADMKKLAASMSKIQQGASIEEVRQGLEGESSSVEDADWEMIGD